MVMANRQRVPSLAGLELPIEEFELPLPHSTKGSEHGQANPRSCGRSPWRRSEKTIGRGAYGDVWLQERDADQPYPHARAVKEVVLSQLRADGIDHGNEISVLAEISQLKHQDQAVFGEFYGWSRNSDTLFLAMEYFPLGDLKRHIEDKMLEEGEVKKITYDVLVGLQVMHAANMVHRDVKPQNILVAEMPPESPWSVKLADFGISRRIPPERQGDLTRRGAHFYTAPEAEHYVEVCWDCLGAMDIWSVGILVYHLATGSYPFRRHELHLFCQGKGDIRVTRPMLGKYSDEGIAFVEALLRPLPRDRPSAEEAIQHPWIKSMIEESDVPYMSLLRSAQTCTFNTSDAKSEGVCASRKLELFPVHRTQLGSTPSPPIHSSPVTLSMPGPARGTIMSLLSSPHIRQELPRTSNAPSCQNNPTPSQALLCESLEVMNESNSQESTVIRAPVTEYSRNPARQSLETISVSNAEQYPLLLPPPQNPPPRFSIEHLHRLPPMQYLDTSPRPQDIPRIYNLAPASTAPDTLYTIRSRDLDEGLFIPYAADPGATPMISREAPVRRASAPGLCRQIEDEIDLVSPRNNYGMHDPPSGGASFKDPNASFQASNSQGLADIAFLGPPPPPLPRDTSPVWRDIRMMRMPRSLSDSFMPVLDDDEQAHRAWKRERSSRVLARRGFRNEMDAFLWAIENDQADVVDLILERGGDVNKKFRDDLELRCSTALHLATMHGKPAVVRMLLQWKASLEARAEAKLSHFQMKHLTPLHLAAFYGFEEIARILLDAGARVEANATGNRTEGKRRTPLHMAVLGEGHSAVPELVSLLLQYGANPEVKDEFGLRPGDYAVMEKRKSLVPNLPTSGNITANMAKMRIKFRPFALVAAPLVVRVAGAAMMRK